MLPLRDLKQKVVLPMIWVKNLLDSVAFLSYTASSLNAEK